MKNYQNISSLLIILICLFSLARVGYSMWPLLIILIQAIAIVVNNKSYKK